MTTKKMIPYVVASLMLVTACKEKKETKTNASQEPTVQTTTEQKNENIGLTTQIFNDDSGKEYKILFNTNKSTPIATVTYDDKEVTLTQTVAWAKGAEYTSDDAFLRVNGNEATFTCNDLKVSLKSK